MKNEKRIVYIQFTNAAAYPSLEHSSLFLAREGWSVLFLGTVAFSGAMRFELQEGIEVKNLKFCPAGIMQKVQFLYYILWGFFSVMFWRPRWIYASDFLSTPLAYVLSFFFGGRVIYHEHDALAPDASRSFFMRLALYFRKKLVERARLCVIPNQDRLDTFVKEVHPACKCVCVWNLPARNEVVAPRSPFEGKVLWLFYHGSIVSGQLPVQVLDAMLKLPSFVHLRIVGYETIGSVGYVDFLFQEAKRKGLEGRVEYVGSVKTRKELLDCCARSDVGLALFARLTHQPMVGASNKPFEYLACGLPVLVPEASDWKDFFVVPGFGLACDPLDPESIALQVRWFIEHPDQMRSMGEQGRLRIAQDWNYESRFMSVYDLLKAGT